MTASDPGLLRSLVSRSTRFVSLRVLTGGLSVVASLVLYRLLGPEEAGRFQFVLALGMTLGVVGGAGMMETLARFVPERAGEDTALFRGALARVIVVVTVIELLLWAGIHFTGTLADAAHTGLILPFFVLVYALYTAVLGMFRGRGRLEILPALDLGWNFGAKVAAILAALSAPLFIPAFTAYTGFAFAVLIAALAFLRISPLGPMRALAAPEARFARWILAAELVRALARTVDIYVIRGLLGPEATGVFVAGARLTAVVEQLVLAPIGVPLLYYFSHPASADLRKRVVEGGSRLIGGLMGAGALVLALAAGPVVQFLLGDAYADSAEVARLYTGHAVGASLLVLLLPLYNSKDRPGLGVAQAGTLLGLTLLLDLLLIPRFGVLGAAAAGVASTALTALVFSWVVRGAFGVGIRSVVIRVLLLYAAGYALLAWGWGAASLPVYIAGLFALRLLKPGDLNLLRRRELS